MTALFPRPRYCIDVFVMLKYSTYNVEKFFIFFCCMYAQQRRVAQINNQTFKVAAIIWKMAGSTLPHLVSPELYECENEGMWIGD